MIGYCELCELRETCKYIYADFCPYIIEEGGIAYV